MTEKREYRRYSAKKRALALVSHELMPFDLIDVSKGGIAFKYLGAEPMNTKSKELDLLYEDGLCLHGIPFEMVSDVLIQENHITFRRCGVKFGVLTLAQQIILDDFIMNYTYGTA